MANSARGGTPTGTGGLNPGDDAKPGTPGSGENTCPACGGSGRVENAPCQECGGTGVVTEGIGGG
ncbi:hypothetical protein [Enterovirga aerilata]|uniref:Molecular chaperone DnaJ n=1 Tax=Enterovirga aerilata TaxID=2730920 RepID=A0A849I8E5_9HYPH|nr:hypothetical protein [Enterovirga sp. DB1703]NNM72267.1 hypothetical protein [Enterovirga sp. DB1703]